MTSMLIHGYKTPTPFSPTNRIDRHDKTEILLNMAFILSSTCEEPDIPSEERVVYHVRLAHSDRRRPILDCFFFVGSKLDTIFLSRNSLWYHKKICCSQEFTDKLYYIMLHRVHLA
jgi:hypothetical protein